jgi:NAD/NADP transhydrogenase beta subunit
LPTFEGPLFFKNNTSMIFVDAKKTLQESVSEFKAA